MKFCTLLQGVHSQIESHEGFDVLSMLPNFDSLSGCLTVGIGNKTRRGHLVSAGITNKQPSVVSKDSVEVSVRSVDCAASICEGTSNKNKCDTTMTRLVLAHQR